MTEIFHQLGPGEANRHVAFLHLGTPVRGEVIDPGRARLLDGSAPRRSDPVVCGGCGERVAAWELTWI